MIVRQQAEYLADKHKYVTYWHLKDKDLLENPGWLMNEIQSGLNDDYVAKGFSYWV